MILFALPFAGVGIWVLVLGVIPTLYDWARMRGWQPAEAILTRANLESHSGDDSTTYSVSATYHYHFAGRDYQGDRVAIGAAADNIGSFQQDLGRLLERALASESPVAIWVNPDDPAQAVIDRSLRPGFLMFKMIFVLAFGGVGVGLLVYQFNHRTPADFDSTSDPAPWLRNAAWATNRISASQGAGIWMVWCFALLWNLISAPILFVLPGELAAGNFIALLGLLFILFGVILLRWACRLARDWRRYGDLYLSLDPFPGAIGGQVGGTVDLGLPYLPQHRFRVTLECVFVHETGSGEDSQIHEKTLWQSEGIASTKACDLGTRIQFRFDIPQNLPASQSARTPYHCWRLDLKSATPAVRLDRQFEIPVFHTKETSRYLDRDSAAHPDIMGARLERIEKVCRFARIAGGVELEFPMLRHWKNSLAGFCLGAVFAAAGIAMGKGGAPLIFPWLFTGLGGVIAAVCVYALGNRFNVVLDGRGLLLRNFFCGIPIGRKEIPRAMLANLKLRESYSTNAGSSRRTIYKVLLETSAGKFIKVADSLEGEAAAQYLLDTISLYSGIPAA